MTVHMRVLLSLSICAAINVSAACRSNAQPGTTAGAPSTAGGSQAPGADVDLAALQAEVTRLKGVVPSASVAMADVGFHFANLWFAGERENWALANYYFSEARNHVRWLVRITPTPKGPDGNLVDLQGIFEGIDTSAFKDVKDAIDAKSRTRFEGAYRQALEACYSCHKSVGRPYLRPQIPQGVPQPIINLDPEAGWPQ
jgi:hypothetical protein